MQGDPTVIELLNDVLTGELTSINQYFVHAKLCQNWGYKRLYEKVYNESIEEMKHADELIDRIIFLDGVPNVQRYRSVRIGETVPEQFELDMGLERDAIERLREGITTCYDKLDHVTRDLLQDILEDEEEHVDWLETQQETIRQVGLELYLSQHIRE